MKKAIFAGTFDPPTSGHLDLIKRSAALFGIVEVAVASRSVKKGSALPLEDRLRLVKKMVKGLKNVEVVPFTGLIVDFAKERGADVLVRGVRNGSDLEVEMQMASANRMMTGIETVCLLSAPEYSLINSSLIREIAEGGKSVEGFVPSSIGDEVSRLLN